MINLDEHITVIEGKEYIPLEVVKKLLENTVVTQESYAETQAKFDEAMSKIRNAVITISKDINDIIKDD